jgi:hypothetical protein
MQLVQTYCKRQIFRDFELLCLLLLLQNIQLVREKYCFKLINYVLQAEDSLEQGRVRPIHRYSETKRFRNVIK